MSDDSSRISKRSSTGALIISGLLGVALLAMAIGLPVLTIRMRDTFQDLNLELPHVTLLWMRYFWVASLMCVVAAGLLIAAEMDMQKSSRGLYQLVAAVLGGDSARCVRHCQRDAPSGGEGHCPVTDAAGSLLRLRGAGERRAPDC